MGVISLPQQANGWSGNRVAWAVLPAAVLTTTLSGCVLLCSHHMTSVLLTYCNPAPPPPHPPQRNTQHISRPPLLTMVWACRPLAHRWPRRCPTLRRGWWWWSAAWTVWRRQQQLAARRARRGWAALMLRRCR
jgi:hypothetical protein